MAPTLGTNREELGRAVGVRDHSGPLQREAMDQQWEQHKNLQEMETELAAC